MNLIYVCFAIYVIVDLISSLSRAAEHSAREAAHQKAMNAIKNIVESEDNSSDEKVASLKLMFRNDVL
ncbi:MAG: hypothetical protein A3I26_00860 [Candidatus Yanofskybacteria bacterium RIFCSPLOWO2_02_FULL_43_10]|uniref:Uncharacterized protein n=1 Tax=Candidatus Yanofskybacteria bacterium RIFCSPLOWO2_12_FULL_43_11b TaxID=1802710 RepID=A0A1F8H9N5_9BACT|nr:MAG: hypothetical protein A2742_03040 [Candidatus Yanofskybacteria bacterium RIFCSPHIGHO2_01_FULL_43_32]OGN11438.1 MAG: hypothetical protein A3C69_01140 [Candidatus Yanofskybacteria bacterium RIFCSPHIGHO2_02_FULL_43_12]OGN17463.1 MAG: hypothetical protein A3E34_02085 [Candidatus Yanofskybacteria bacterium RIFCSPHIGHO2_12_FULL_43_11]OGN24918.1 MAG: hypothetical protein A2923_02810 [Candidatus Yanofskybacteria bacterium RIFCSPLOWO2_01_FULL_43_46]OGN29350.1 MAG: hypothetical protein A3I26_00860